MNKSEHLNIKIYHIVHLDNLASIIKHGCLWSDSIARSKGVCGTIIGMSHIKARRLIKKLQSHPELTVGECVPFYFCPRSVMLYIISQKRHEDISYRGGQKLIIHLQADFNEAVMWARQNKKRWAFTDSNAGSSYFNDYSYLDNLKLINWKAVNSSLWSKCKEQKQAEFLIEEFFPWSMVELIGVHSMSVCREVYKILDLFTNQPPVKVKPEWYY